MLHSKHVMESYRWCPCEDCQDFRNEAEDRAREREDEAREEETEELEEE